MKIRQVDFYPDEWLAGTHGLDAVETGIYITACALIYSHGGAVPREELRLRVRCHGHAFNRAYGRLLELGKLVENDAQITNKRCANEIQKAAKRIANAQQNGDKSGGRPRKNNEIENPSGLETEKLTTNHQPPTTNQKEDSVGSDEPTAAPAPPDLTVVAGRDFMPEPELRATVFSVGKDTLGKSAGGLIRKLIDCHAGDLQATLDTLLMAKRKEDPRSYICRIIAGEAAPESDWDAVYRRMGVRL